MGNEQERFQAMLRPQTNGCILWGGSVRADGYATFTVGSTLDGTRRTIYVHRFAYEQAKGPVPAGLVLDHLCRKPSCVNPDHLEAVPQRTNILRGEAIHATNAAKTHCDQGHPFDEANTRITKEGWRDCRRCGIVNRQRAIERRRASKVV